MENTADIPYIRPMVSAVRGVGFAVAALIVLGLVGGQSLLAYFFAFLVLGVLTLAVWGFLFLAARSGAVLGYAYRHLALCVLLTPVFLIGVFAIPFLVRADLLRLRQSSTGAEPGLALDR